MADNTEPLALMEEIRNRIYAYGMLAILYSTPQSFHFLPIHAFVFVSYA